MPEESTCVSTSWVKLKAGRWSETMKFHTFAPVTVMLAKSIVQTLVSSPADSDEAEHRARMRAVVRGLFEFSDPEATSTDPSVVAAREELHGVQNRLREALSAASHTSPGRVRSGRRRGCRRRRPLRRLPHQPSDSGAAVA